MGKIIDRLTELEKTGSPSVSFEFFPAKTEDGVFNLLNRVEEMGFQLQPTFVTLTWRSAFKDEKLWLKIGSHIQNEFKIDVLMHLTCHLPREQLREILKNVRAAGIRNILALRGDPPIGSERWKAIPGGFQNAVELIRFIREEHGDWFCIAAAGYAEVHTEAWNNPNLPPSDQVRRVDMLRLKEKQDAGADFIITQFFFDVDNVPPQVEDALVTIKNDDSAVKKYGIQLAVDTCRKLLANNLSLHFYTMNLATTVRTVLEGLHLIERERGLPWGAPITRSKDGTLEKSIEQLPWCEQGLSGESTIIRENLRWINSMGFLTINSQPRINGAPSEDPSVGWGGKDGFVFQKAYVEFFVPPHLMQRLVVRDIFKIFARVITESMTKDDLRQRVLELEGKNEKLHETVAKLKIIQAEANRELKDLHGDLSTSREENSRLKAQVRELRSRLAMAEL
ncbi:hypothetical protein DYB25_002295 [Aphanomyces astaci]|uniref:MTHFR SAM-binding regulatory domain-containing protein n=1 Tax=Aphanomyces astaci TaxID=112090 RepID=A0A397C6V8_APHAT|nr:hypothetical protein DYB36_004012 [Aphanomyces astaci]RHY18730.1 hypothetical protein DYB25_002295 [Aphanomyces astaci]RHY38493.1 hypothetical protein DYB38_003556 [Aphanomyces astaci]RHY41688.1 hypothetical protein DYB34_003408 [Aphanomyces astaci]RHY57468.1 hypothetical protein DYB30_000283 [Aphanomyces astaci]